MSEVYEIDLTKKYIIRLPADIHPSDYERIKTSVQRWIDSDDMPILIIPFDVQLVKVEE